MAVAGGLGTAGVRARGGLPPEGKLPPLRFACPRCRALLEAGAGALTCPACGASHSRVDGIPTFVEEGRYWGEIPEEDMAWLAAEVEAGRPWREVVTTSDRRAIRDKAAFLLDERRAGWALELGLEPAAEILDVGAGMGGVAAGLASHAARVVALEPVRLRARFARARFAQDGLGHVEVVRGSALELPFPPASFDVAVLSGVLEWVGKGSRDPGGTQLAVLRRLREVLRPDGALVVAIENRIGLWFFFGREDHSYLPYTSLMPRWLANRVTLKRRGEPYDTYTYTHRGYRRLLAAAGFERVRTVLPIWGYNAPDYLVPLEAGPRADLASILEAASGRRARRPWLRRLHCSLRLSAPLANDFIFLARGAGAREEPGWLRRELAERWPGWGLGERPRRLSFLIHNRSHPTLVVFADGRREPSVVARMFAVQRTGARAFSPPRAEIEALRRLEPLLGGALVGSVPHPLDLLEPGRHEIGVTTYVAGAMPLLPPGSPDAKAVRRAASALVDIALGWLGEFHRRAAPPGPPPALAAGELAAQVAPRLRAALPDGAELAARLAARLDPLGSLGPVARAPQHGDFVVSNLRLEGERVRVIDWERFGRVPMPGFDALHLVTYLVVMLASDRRSGRVDARAVVQLLAGPGPLGAAIRAPLARYLAAQGLDPALFPALLAAYLAGFIAEYGGERARRGIVGTMGDLLRTVLSEPSAARP